MSLNCSSYYGVPLWVLFWEGRLPLSSVSHGLCIAMHDLHSLLTHPFDSLAQFLIIYVGEHSLELLAFNRTRLYDSSTVHYTSVIPSVVSIESKCTNPSMYYHCLRVCKQAHGSNSPHSLLIGNL